jgi:tetratricopeptide (TPR) repeat protein
LYNASFPISHQGDVDRAMEYLAEALEIAETAGDGLGVGRAYWGLCNVATFERRYEEAIRYATLAAAQFETLDAPFDLGWTRFMLAQGHFLLGHLDDTRRYLDETMPLFVAARDLSAIVLVLYLETAVLVAEGRDHEAAPLLGALETLKLRTGATIADVEQNQYEPVRELMRDHRDDIQAEIARGRRMGVDEALAIASSL